jgi:hypothetical protein
MEIGEFKNNGEVHDDGDDDGDGDGDGSRSIS